MQNLPSSIQLIYQGYKNPPCHRLLIETANCISWTSSMTCSYVIPFILHCAVRIPIPMHVAIWIIH